MKIVTWNVNSINARIEHLVRFIKKDQSDMYLIQELKCINESFPYTEIEKLGYISYVEGQKAWNGVAILSKTKLKILNKKIPIFGICHGAQFLAKKFGCKFNKSKHHVQNHYIEIIDNKSEKRKQLVNSYHNIIIIKKSKKVDIFAIAGDNSIEAFCHKKLKIGGIIWHPERFKKFRNTDIKIIKKLLFSKNI